MSRLSELRNRSEKNKMSLQSAKVERVKATVLDVVNSDAFNLSLMDKVGGSKVSDEETQRFAEEVAKQVTDIVLDPKANFLDTCKSRGLNERKIAKAIDQLNKCFGLTESTNYEDKLEVVALYMANNPQLYDDLLEAYR